jgi:Putative MetA-pathway of phenol degradation
MLSTLKTGIPLAMLAGLPFYTHAELRLQETPLVEDAQSREKQHRESERPSRLLRLEEAYNQDRGEWQLRVQTEYVERTERETEETGPTTIERTNSTINTVLSTFSIEYGITEQLEFDISLPFVITRDTETGMREFDSEILTSSENVNFDDSGLGDLELGFSLAITEESGRDQPQLLPAVTLSLGVSVPTADESDGFGAGTVLANAGLALTKSFGPYYATANVEFAAGDRIREYEYGIGLLYLFGHTGWGFAVEVAGEIEDNADEPNSEHALHVIPSASYGWADVTDRRWQIDLGIPVGLTGLADASDEIGVIFHCQVEF